MNAHHPDLLRQGVPNMHQGLMSQQFLPQQPQQGQPHNMGLLQNNQGANPGLGLMGGQPGAPSPSYPLNMQQPRRSMFPHPNMGPNGGAGPSHMGGLAPNQLQNMPAFPGGGMMAQPSIRRVQSQQLGQTGAHMQGLQPSMMTGGMSMNGQPQMTGVRGTMPPGHLQMRQQQQQQQVQGGGMSSEMGLPMNRPAPGHMQGANLPPHARTASGQQMMPTLTQPSSLPQSHGMQQGPMSHNAFGNPMSLPHQHQQSQLGSSSSHVGSSGQQSQGMGGAMTGNPMLSQGSGNRPQMTPDNPMLMNFSNGPMQQSLPHGVPRMPMNNMNNPQYNIAPSSSPLNAGGDMSQRGNAPMNAQGPMTPAGLLDQMSASGENFPPGPYMGQPSVAAPPRPLSHNGPHNGFSMSQSQPSLPPQRSSPRQPDHLTTPMHHAASTVQRPHSQPQAAHRQSPIPPGPSRTPRVSAPSLPMNAAGNIAPPPRVPTAPGQSPRAPPHQPVQPPASAPSSAHSMPPAPRNSAPAGAAPTASTSTAIPTGQRGATPDSNQPARPPVSAPATVPPPPAPASAPGPPPPGRLGMYPVGFGQGICRILQLSGSLAGDSKDRLNMAYWEDIVTTYFTEKATMKLTLWKDNQQVEAKPFEIGYPIFPRFFLVTSQSGVKSQTITIDGSRERLINSTRALVECANAAWTFRYTNGYSITLRGPLTAEVLVVPSRKPPPQPPAGSPFVQNHSELRIDRLQFDAFWHDKYLAFEAIHGDRIPDSPRAVPMSPNTVIAQNGPPEEMTRYDVNRFDEPRYLIDHAIIPTEPINAFGIPQATMRCLELAESVAQMSDLIQFSAVNKLGPLAALTAFANKVRKEQAANRTNYNGDIIPSNILSSAPGSSSYSDHVNGASSGSFAGNIPGPSQTSLGGGDQQNAAHLDGPSKQGGKAGPPVSQASGSTPSAQASTPASAPTPGGPTTPSLASASLKRKAAPGQRAGEDSPTTANADQQPAAKRANRKRGRTQGS